MYKEEDFADFTIFELLQNISNYSYSLKITKEQNIGSGYRNTKLRLKNTYKRSGNSIFQI